MEHERPQEEQLFTTEDAQTNGEVDTADFTAPEKESKSTSEQLADVRAQLDQEFEKTDPDQAKVYFLRQEVDRLEAETGQSGPE